MRLSAREKWVVAGGAILVACIAFWFLVWDPARTHMEKLDQKIRAKRAEYREVQDLAQRLQELEVGKTDVEQRLSRSKGFSVLSYLENLALKHKVRNRISQMRAKGGQTTRYFQENGFEVKMEKVSLREVVPYLLEVEHPEAPGGSKGVLRVTQLRMHQRSEDKNLLDVVFQVSSYEPLEKG